eukprot:gnl/TRDRNA2_/TRDRNA2_194250_c0_seq1.p1 gnl/TRDRNA2_/TRDRNA2_194250_c0~~gnl/TRDRNA2_/TRDRNA2_194250_c0_seq1.p1  ORF type:complete len:451 (+),score=88.74 gnl/TRDRNA2_/TRDRNA2_194250_c0_seq1:152-1504(+)
MGAGPSCCATREKEQATVAPEASAASGAPEGAAEVLASEKTPAATSEFPAASAEATAVSEATSEQKQATVVPEASAASAEATAGTEAAVVSAEAEAPKIKDAQASGRGSDGDSDEEVDPLDNPVFKALDKVLDEWLVTGMHRAGAKKFIRDRIANGDPESSRVRQWLLLRMNGKVWDHQQPMMCRTPENVPGLRSFHVWPREESTWLPGLEARYTDILQEIMAARNASTEGQRSGFQPYRDPVTPGTADKLMADGVGVEGVDSGAWNVLYLYLNHKRFADNCERFPLTMKAIEEAFPRHYSHAFFSALTPGAHIVKHTGPSNRMLRAWLPLCGLDGFRLRVGDTIVKPKAGEAFVWDHSFEHEAWHDGDETRVVLIVDIWHPDLTAPEVKLLSTLQNCRLRAARALAEHCEGKTPEDQTYFDIVENARHLLTDDDWWIVKAELDPTTRPT